MSSKNVSSYFIRHNLDITRDAMMELWLENKIAIHYKDVDSLDDKDYIKKDATGKEVPDKGAKRALRVFTKLQAEGGYVWAEYPTINRIKVGIVSPERYKKLLKPKPRPNESVNATLKTLRIENPRVIEPHHAMSLKVARPPMTTITEWKAVGKKLECLVKGEPMPEKWGSLSDSEQETVCAEYLRNPDIAEPNFPILKHLLLPVGRTMQDVDIYGITVDNKQLLAQVTFRSESESKSKSKREKLKGYGDNNANSCLVFFCGGNCEDYKLEEGVWVVPWQRVEMWLIKQDACYRTQQFSIT